MVARRPPCDAYWSPATLELPDVEGNRLCIVAGSSESTRDMSVTEESAVNDLVGLRNAVRNFLDSQLAEKRFVPQCDSWLSGWNESFTRNLADQGWVGMTIPAQYGGAGRSFIERYVVTEELLAAGAPVAAHWIADRQIAPALLRYGTERQREDLLPKIARGEFFFALGMSEPDAGSDLASVQLRATRANGGWVLRGTKIWTSGAHRAHAIMALARTARLTDDRRQGLSQFIVPTSAPGLTIRPIPLLTKEHHFNEVFFDDVFVPEANILGVEGEGWNQVTNELAFERSGPERFLSSYPLLTHVADKIVDRANPESHAAVGTAIARLVALRELSQDVASKLNDGQEVGERAALVKDIGTRFERDVIDLARTTLDIEPDLASPDDQTRLLAQAILHAPGFTIRGGTNEILRGVIARSLGLR